MTAPIAPSPCPALSLAGTWRTRLDREDAGMRERWFTRALILDGNADATTVAEAELTLPGSLQAQGFGDVPSLATRWVGAIADRSFFESDEFAEERAREDLRLPFWLTPRRHYVGVAWLEREIEVPAELAGRPLTLELERVHWFSAAWLDGQPLASADGAGGMESLHTPHRFAAPSVAAGLHRLTLRLDNRLHIAVGENAHSVSDHTQTNWLGVIGRLELRAQPTAALGPVALFPAADARSLEVRLTACPTGNLSVRVIVQAPDGATLADLTQPFAPALIVTLAADAPRWDEFSPALCRVRVELLNAATGAVLDTCEERIGFRTLGTSGRHLTINGRRLFLRGTLDCAAYPLTGHPPMEREAWERIFATIRAHGLNHVRFHSWCPPEVAFAVADELGLYLQVECGTWTEVGRGGAVDGWVEREGDRILATYGNHPSLCALTHGNEPQGGAARDVFLGRLVERWRAADGRHLYTAGAGWPEIAASDFHVPYAPRIHGWTAERRSRINALPPETTSDYRHYTAQHDRPVVVHESGQWCAFPNLRERARYTGLLRAGAFDLVADRLTRRGQAHLADAFLHASGKLQALCYKEEIESALRTPDFGGFQLLGLSDFPGQGTAPVGVLDVFWEEKGYIAPEEFRRFCAPTVPLAALPKRVFTTAETLTARVLVAHYGARPLTGATLGWRLRDASGVVVREGVIGSPRPSSTLALGLNRLGDLAIDCAGLAAPARHTLELALAGTPWVNDWHIWVYPESSALSAPGVLIHDRLDALTLGALERGETVILSPGEDGVAPDPVRGPVKLGFSPIFWNTAWTSGQAPHTLGVLCDPAHPALAEFPTEAHSDWQWWYVVTRAHALVLDALPPEVEPLVRVIDDWATCRRLALAFEARVGRGRLIATGVELRFGHESNPVARQLLSSLLAYAQSEAFRPAVELTPEQLFTVYPRLGAFDPL